MGQDVSACWWSRSVHCTKAEPKRSASPVQGCALTSSVGFLSILDLFFFFWGRDPERSRERQTEVRTFLLVAVFVPWLATPSLMASLRPRAEQDSDPPTPAAIAACYTDPVQTRRIALHEPRTAIVPCSAGLLLKQVHDRWTEAPQQATVRGGYASLLLYSLLSHCCRCCCCCCRRRLCCHCCFCTRLLFPPL